MSYVEELRAELAARGIREPLAQRIEVEFADHLACDPEAQLGEPALIAARFAEELGVVRTRRASLASFGALALAAILLALSTRALSPAGGWPDLFGVRGLVVAFAGLGIALGAQVSFVAGVLGVSLVASRGGAVRLAQRRMRVALAGGWVVVGGELVDAVALRPLLPAWWFALALGAAAASAVALAASGRALHAAEQIALPHARAVTPLPGPLLAGVAAAAVTAMCVGSAYAEHSWAEGLTRAVFEAVAIGVCFVALGRRLGLRG